jgi:hypothetical protein
MTAWVDTGVPNLPGTQKQCNKSSGTIGGYILFEVSAKCWAEIPHYEAIFLRALTSAHDCALDCIFFHIFIDTNISQLYNSILCFDFTSPYPPHVQKGDQGPLDHLPYSL